MAKAWAPDYTATTAALDVTADDLLFRDASDTTDSATYGTVRRLPINYLLGLSGITPGGRLTLESGVAVSTTNQTAKGTIYYTPDKHDYIRLYDGTRPKLYQFSELSLALTVTSGANYDVFVYDNSGTLNLELSSAWTNDTTRANALAWQTGVGWVKSGAPTRLLLGTMRASGTNTCEQSFATTDAPVKQFLWNAYNRVRMGLFVHDSSDTWTYTTATWRQKRGSANNQIEWVCGKAGALMSLTDNTQAYHGTSNRTIWSGIGIDSTTAISSDGSHGAAYVAYAPDVNNMISHVNYRSALGYHYAAALEKADGLSGTCTWIGDNGSPNVRTGLSGVWEC